MRIAVIGGEGFIGREFVSYAGERGHGCAVIDIRHDVFSPEGEKEIRKMMEGCEGMAFLAARKDTPSFGIEDHLYNVRLAETYFLLAKECGIFNVVTLSSRCVYSSDKLPWKEDFFDRPLNMYGASKQAIDSIALLYNEKHGMRIKSLRLAQVIGKGERKGFLLNTLIDNAMEGKKQSVFGTGLGRKQFIYVKDVCDAMLHALVNESDDQGIFNIGMEGNVSVLELAGLINEVFGNEAGIEVLADKPEDRKEYLMDVSKAKRELHWKPSYDLKEAIADLTKEKQ